MRIQNRLKAILDATGLYKYQPTPELLQRLGGMTHRRFYQILRNESSTEMDMVEKEAIELWLMDVFNMSRDQVNLMVESKALPA